MAEFWNIENKFNWFSPSGKTKKLYFSAPHLSKTGTELKVKIWQQSGILSKLIYVQQSNLSHKNALHWNWKSISVRYLSFLPLRLLFCSAYLLYWNNETVFNVLLLLILEINSSVFNKIENCCRLKIFYFSFSCFNELLKDLYSYIVY